MVFKAAMTQDYSKIQELLLWSQGITEIDSGNQVLRRMAATLRKIDLSMNHLRRIEGLETLQNLRELIIANNELENMDGLAKLHNLRSLNLDGNKIRSLRGLRGLRKLERLSLARNLISEATPADSTEAMLDLRDLNLSGNQIKCVEGAHTYPNLEDLNLSNNPLSMIFPAAFKSNQSLQALTLDNAKFSWPKEDLLFLKELESCLVRLSMNSCFPK